MSNDASAFIKEYCAKTGRDPARLLDVAREVQARFGCVSPQSITAISREMKLPRADVEGLVTFYAFLSTAPKGRYVIRLCNDVVDMMKGARDVGETFSRELGIKFGRTTADGLFSLEWTPCIGMSDQAPAALINETVFTHLDGDKARRIVGELRRGSTLEDMVDTFGDGNNAHPLVRSMVMNNIRMRGPVIFSDFQPGSALKKALSLSPAEVIRDIKTSRLRGRGGAGFPTGMKWDFTRQAEGAEKYVLCNADEGEPGTFKDRVILTECPHLFLEGMTIAGYAIGARKGIIYLRGEYAYLRAFLEKTIQDRRDSGLLGRGICGKADFEFDIRVQMGAGAYVCGEETSLISSCEGSRGDPKNRPPFPAQKGFLGRPTVVNNVETFACAARILDQGPGWFANMGSNGSPGTKLLSVSGDCRRPGVYEVPFGIKLRDFLRMADASDAAAVQVGGPSGQMVGPADFDRTICYDDLATGGSIIVFDSKRDVLETASAFMEFFVEESCGFCTPCRVGNFLLKQRLDKVLSGRGEPSDLDALRELAETVRFASRCGFGQTSPNPILTTLKNFRSAYEKRVKPNPERIEPSFDIRAALADAENITGRKSVLFPA